MDKAPDSAPEQDKPADDKQVRDTEKPQPPRTTRQGRTFSGSGTEKRG